ncbi:hypothetical protein T02_16175 [Trichinella nativa]|uniref:Uncharacterized protein n=1 Tax=Trichinella nativa TaxID=6335 RepID=A0A0V1LCK6_9BILA|nr:hypothetical protein T02_16175 [Trichinella nativa]
MFASALLILKLLKEMSISKMQTNFLNEMLKFNKRLSCQSISIEQKSVDRCKEKRYIENK